MWTLGRIRQALRAGATPQEMGGVYLDTGSTWHAWRLGRFVVKGYARHEFAANHGARCQADAHAYSAIRAAGVRAAPTASVDLWRVQVFYPPATVEELPTTRRADGDWAACNMGRDHRGRLVVFDP